MAAVKYFVNHMATDTVLFTNTSMEYFSSCSISRANYVS